MTRLVLVRHAKAEAPRPGLDDHDRALTLEGRSSAQSLANALADAGVEIAVALVSSAVRTQQTWKLMATAFPDADARTVPELYETHVGGVVAALRGAGSDGTVAVVGHEPTISATAAWLAGPGSDTPALQRIAHGLPTGTAALLDFEGDLADLAQRAAVLTAICSSHAHF
jgi:phosphohistidine phosphatase